MRQQWNSRRLRSYAQATGSLRRSHATLADVDKNSSTTAITTGSPTYFGGVSTPLAPDGATPKVTALAVDVEFLRCADRTMCRSAAFVPFRMSGGDDAEFDKFAGVAFAVHLPVEVTMVQADVLPAGWALQPHVLSPHARRIFGSQPPSPYCIPNPWKNRDKLRRIATAAAGRGDPSSDDLRSLQEMLSSFCGNVAQRAGVTSLIEALSDPFRASAAIDFIEDMASIAEATLRQTLARAKMAGDTVDDETPYSIDEWLVPSIDSWASLTWGNLLTIAANEATQTLTPAPQVPSAEPTRRSELLLTTAKATASKKRPKVNNNREQPHPAMSRGHIRNLMFISYGDADESALNAALAAGRLADLVPIRVLNLHNHRSFSSSMTWLGLRPIPKLTEAIEAVAGACDSVREGPRSLVAKEAAKFLQLTGGTACNHNPVWDAQALAIVTRWTEAFSFVRVEEH